jgi:2-oxoglutarate ferredoxin oxidoreductase subunit delta
MAGVSIRQPLDKATVRIPRGQIYIIPDRCKGCGFCIDFCPRDVLVETSDMNAKGYHYPIVAEGKEEECIACQFCSIVCPEFAIYSEEIGE